ncbi:MAG: leucyl/phenylalanyl-tRNA--protein transferase [Deltaproteobacteria bacterium]|nr:MAG: leucyl/phenylalanyl-tRNA--protein transferase [Deltaproteobacteria bacterium]
MTIFRLSAEPIFPDPEQAEENGLLAVGGDLSPARLLAAYSQGIFPWYSEGEPILWWFTSPRLVLFPEKIKISSRLARYYRKPLFRVSMDTAFEQVIQTCAEIPRADGGGTWLTKEMRAAYIELYQMGFAHSVECWDGDTLAGGLYGVSLDRVFFGESMFSRQSNGSKIALIALADHLQKKGVALIDCQMTTSHLLRMGAEEIPGRTFSRLIRENIGTIWPDGCWDPGRPSLLDL